MFYADGSSGFAVGNLGPGASDGRLVAWMLDAGGICGCWELARKTGTLDVLEE
jgi:hypothetical protein